MIVGYYVGSVVYQRHYYSSSYFTVLFVLFIYLFIYIGVDYIPKSSQCPYRYNISSSGSVIIKVIQYFIYNCVPGIHPLMIFSAVHISETPCIAHHHHGRRYSHLIHSFRRRKDVVGIKGLLGLFCTLLSLHCIPFNSILPRVCHIYTGWRVPFSYISAFAND